MNIFDCRCNLIPEMMLYNMSLYVQYLFYPFTSILHLFGVDQEWFLTILFRNLSSGVVSLLSHFYFLFFYLTQCLWFDLHRHLFLLVLFLLCACDYNQEMEIQKSTCCHSKYVLFHLLTTFLITSHPPRLCSVIYPFSLHGFSGRAVLLTELTYLPGFVTVLILTSLNSFDSLSVLWRLFQSASIFLLFGLIYCFQFQLNDHGKKIEEIVIRIHFPCNLASGVNL